MDDVGTNKRYPHHSGQLAEARELREARAHGALHTLTDHQLRLHVEPVTVVPERVTKWALAWLRFGDADVRCTVRVRRWTPQAVGVEVNIEGEILRCWIWQGACVELIERRDAWG